MYCDLRKAYRLAEPVFLWYGLQKRADNPGVAVLSDLWMLGIGLASLAISQFSGSEKE